MIQLDDFKKFDFRHLTTKEFFELEGLLARLLRERNAYREMARASIKDVDKAAKKLLGN